MRDVAAVTPDQTGRPVKLRPVVSEYDLRLTQRQVTLLFNALDFFLPYNSQLPQAQLGEPRQRWDDQERKDLDVIRMALFEVVHG